MKNRTITLDKDIVRVLQSEKGDGTTWNEYMASLLGYTDFKDFKKENTLQVFNENQLEIDLDEKV